MSLCMNCNTHGTDDMEVISNLIKIRLKPKVLLNHYMLCVRSVSSPVSFFDSIRGYNAPQLAYSRMIHG